MTRVEDIVKREGKWWIIGLDMRRAWPTVLYKNLVRPAVLATAITLPLVNAATHHIYKTLVENREKTRGEEHALKYASDSIIELEKEVPSAARTFFFLGAEFYLHKYVSTHYQQK